MWQPVTVHITTASVTDAQAEAESLRDVVAVQQGLFRQYGLNVVVKDYDSLSDEFRALTGTLTRVSPELRGDDALRATVRKMSTDDAAAAASAVVRIFGAVARASTNSSSKSVTNVVPLQLAPTGS